VIYSFDGEGVLLVIKLDCLGRSMRNLLDTLVAILLM